MSIRRKVRESFSSILFSTKTAINYKNDVSLYYSHISLYEFIKLALQGSVLGYRCRISYYQGGCIEHGGF